MVKPTSIIGEIKELGITSLGTEHTAPGYWGGGATRCVGQKEKKQQTTH